ncbi:MAG: hypothetical protein OEZ58_17720 [Gammaproteobacteria bacterium]|nr:hypothetical protein [Gammaproteobacteria bacterium]MDH5730831.1 hypothetical protein [Gammaproteobacteria bacterium]
MQFANTKQIIKCLLQLCMLFFAASQFTSASEKASKTTGEPAYLTVKSFAKTSFSPARKETFVIPISVQANKSIRKIDVEIRSNDDDLIRAISFKDFKKKQTDYEIVWDGKDSEGKLVPNEAYFPVFIVTSASGDIQRIDKRKASGGEELYDFEKRIRNGVIEYTLPHQSRVLVRTGIKNGPMLRTIIDWEPRSAGFHAERWNGYDLDNVIAIERNPKVGHLIIAYRLSEYSIITYGNDKQSYRAYREAKKWPLRQSSYQDRILERNGKLIRPEYYMPVLQQKSPRISVAMLDVKRKPLAVLKGLDELITEVKIHPLDEIYLDQERYEISFFIDNEFIAEEEQGFVPFTWRWSPGRFGIKPGDHVLTINVSGYSGQVGVKNIAFTLQDSSAN